MFWTTNAARSEEKQEEEEEDTAIPASEESGTDSDDSAEEESDLEGEAVPLIALQHHDIRVSFSAGRLTRESEDSEESDIEDSEESDIEDSEESEEDEDEEEEDESEDESEDEHEDEHEDEDGVCLAHAVLDLTERVAKAARDDEFIRSAREVFVNQWLSNHDAFLALSTEQLHFLRSALDFPAAETQSDDNVTTELH
jgi:hypothetical protein